MNLLAVSVCQSLFCCPDLCRVTLFQKWVWILESYTWKGPKEMALSRLSKLWKVIRYAIQDWFQACVHLFLTYSLSLYYFSSISVGVGICQRTRQNTHFCCCCCSYIWLSFLEQLWEYKSFLPYSICIFKLIFSHIYPHSNFICRHYPFSVGNNYFCVLNYLDLS